MIELEPDVYIFGADLLHRRKRFLHALDHGERGGVRSLGHLHVDRSLAVDVGVAGYDIRSIFNRGDVAQEDRGLLPGLHWSFKYFAEIPTKHCVVRCDAGEVSGAHIAGGHHDAGAIDGGDCLFWRDAILPQLIRIQTDHDGALIATERRRRRDAGQRGEDGSHAIQSDVLHLTRGTIGAGKNQLADGHAACVKSRDEWRHRARRHKCASAIDVADHLRHRVAHVRSGVEHELHQRRALDVFRLDMLYARDVKEVVLVVVRHETFHLRGIHAAIGLCYVHRGRAHIRKNVDGHALHRHISAQRDCEHSHQHGDRPAHRS